MIAYHDDAALEHLGESALDAKGANVGRLAADRAAVAADSGGCAIGRAVGMAVGRRCSDNDGGFRAHLGAICEGGGGGSLTRIAEKEMLA